MKLYPKKLNSLEELKREKHVLKYAHRQMKTESFLSFDDIKPKGTEKLLNAGMIGTILSAVGSKSVFGTILTLAPTLLNLVSRRSGKKNFIESFAKDAVGSYVKWKLVMLAFKAAKRIVLGAKKAKPKARKPSGA